MQLGPLVARVGRHDAFAPAGPPDARNSAGAPLVAPEARRCRRRRACRGRHGAAEPRFDRKYLQDPNAMNRAYTESVQNALIDAMHRLQRCRCAIRPDEFLTVAARDNMQRDTLAPLDPCEEVVTILLRIKGSDLAAYRAGQIDRAELRKRIEVREF